MREDGYNKRVKPYEFIAPSAHIFELADAVGLQIGEPQQPGAYPSRIAEWPPESEGTHYRLEKHDWGAAGTKYVLDVLEGDEQQDRYVIQSRGNMSPKVYLADANGNEIETENGAELEEKVFAILSVDKTASEKAMQVMIDREFAGLAGRSILSHVAVRPQEKVPVMSSRFAEELANTHDEYIRAVEDEERTLAEETGDTTKAQNIAQAIGSKPQSTEDVTYLSTTTQRMIGDAIMQLGGRWRNTLDTTQKPSERIRSAGSR